MNISINLITDFENLLKKQMDEKDIFYKEDDNIIYQYLNYFRKRNIPKVSKVLNTNQMFAFYRYQNQINEIKYCLENNLNLTHRLSTLSKRADVFDNLLNLFNIYHFHLGEGQHPTDSTFSKRSGDLLFVYFGKNSTAYILGVYPHTDWLKDKWFHILYQNWKEDFEERKIKNITPLINFSEDDKERLRKCHVNVFPTIDGIPFFTYSVSTKGGRLDDTKEVSLITRSLTKFETELKGNIIEYINKLKLDKKLLKTIKIGIQKTVEENKSINIYLKEIDSNNKFKFIIESPYFNLGIIKDM